MSEKIKELYKKYGSYDYIGEKVSQSEHMIQSAMLAEEDNQRIDIVIATFLHDIGHLIGIEQKLEQSVYGVIDHEKIAYKFLKDIGFKYPIPELVLNHVNAKRYLCYKDPTYYFKLSDASKFTLQTQGGAMNIVEAIEFQNDNLFNVYIKMRNYDERAKLQNIELKDINYYYQLIDDYLVINNCI